MIWPTIGMLAACLTMFSFIPQIIKVVKTKSEKDLSLVMLVQFSLGSFFWTVYGIYLKDAIIITANIITLTSLIVLLFFYFHYARSSK